MIYENIWKKVLGKDEHVEHEFSISDKYRKICLIAWIVFWVVIWGGWLFLLLKVRNPFAIFIFILIFFIGLFYYGFYLKAANAYAFTNKRILIHKGWLSTKLTSIDYSKITDVHTKEPFLDKVIMHVGSITINTAGTSLFEVVLQHIEQPYELKKKLDALKDK